MKLSGLLAIALVLAAPAAAQPRALLSGTDGRWLAGACGSDRPQDRSYCYGYITGVVDQLSLEGAICRPAAGTIEQIVTTVRSHLAASPADSNRHATFLIRRVLTATFPCRR